MLSVLRISRHTRRIAATAARMLWLAQITAEIPLRRNSSVGVFGA
jgi:hypothetical protein